MDGILAFVVAWAPPSIIALLGLGALHQKVKDMAKKVDHIEEKIDQCNVLTVESHDLICNKSQQVIASEIAHIKGDIKELKDTFKESERRREETRGELASVLIELRDELKKGRS